jgi:hypothetical protein
VKGRKRTRVKGREMKRDEWEEERKGRTRKKMGGEMG